MIKIPAKKNEIIEAAIEHITSLEDEMFSSGPVQFYFPQVFSSNAKKLREGLEGLDFETRIYYANKANKSEVFVKAAHKTGICIDVASPNELNNAIKHGFDGQRIECTGVKNTMFIKKCIAHNCLIILDSLDEFQQVKKSIVGEQKPRIAFRINDPFCDEGLYKKVSRFGIAKKDYLALVKYEDLNAFCVEGLHFHNDDYSIENKSNMMSEMLLLYKPLFKKGIFPKILNIGGGYRFSFVNPDHKEALTSDLEQIDFDDVAYANTIFGFSKGRNGKINKNLITSAFFPPDAIAFLNKVLGDSNPKNNIIEELGLAVCIEPGNALLELCGILAIRVIATKQLFDGKCGVVVDGNIYNLAANMKSRTTDPILISRGSTNSNTPYEAYIFGNLCREDDILLDRKVCFDKKPEIGDLLVFINTAAYAGSFEDSNPILQPTNKNYVYTHINNQSTLVTEEEFIKTQA
jgi:diaminopimelate decarboxylase